MISAKIITAITAAQHDDEHLHEHTHVESGSGDFLVELGHLLTNPAHLAFEFIFSIVFDLVIVTLLYGIVIRKVIIPRLKRTLHEEIDREHGVEHKEPEPRK